jgi:hypothetical protein
MINKITPNSVSIDQFKLDDRQALIFERLGRLVSPSIAAFYHDACRHMVIKPPFATTTNIVGHLLREIESSLHDVLEPITGQAARDKFCKKCIQECEQKNNKHKEKIKTVIETLKLPDEIAKAWLSIPGKKGLQKYAHRSGLNQARTVDDEFEQFWQQMQIILRSVLDNFESQYIQIFQKLDELAKKAIPNKKDAAFFCEKIPNNTIAHAHFFNQLDNKVWLHLLKGRGVFKNIPGPEVITLEDGATVLGRCSWPAASYLEKMAIVNPVTVTEIMRELPSIDSPDIKSSLLSIVAKLPRENRIQLMLQIKEWMKSEQYILQSILIEPSVEIINKFIEENDSENAFDMVGVILEIMPDSMFDAKHSKNDGHMFKSKPETRLEKWHYNQFLKKEFQKFVSLDPKRSFDLLCDLLSAYLQYERSGMEEAQDEAYFEDHSYVSRPSIGEHEQNRTYEDVEDALIDAIRDTGMILVRKTPKILAVLISELEDRKWTIFRRIAIHITSEFPKNNKKLVVKYLLNETLFDNSHVEHEQALLMNKGFHVLSIKNQETIIDWIEKSKKIKDRIAEYDETITEEQAKRYIETWQRDQLSYIQDFLPEKWKLYYNELIGKYGEPEHPDFPAYHSESWVGPVSDIDAQGLVDMEVGAMLELLRKWQPGPNKDYRGATKEGLGRELAAAVKLSPKKFVKLANDFKGLDPTYVRSYLQGIEELAKQKCKLNWNDILELCYWVTQQQKKILDRKEGYVDEDPDWDWARKAVLSLISTGITMNLIPYKFRQKIWSVIEKIVHEQFDKNVVEEFSNDAYSLSINSTRGEAMHASIEYALWVYRNIQKTAKGKVEVKKGFKLLPEVRTILDFHLNTENDQSIAVRAMYGKYLPWLILMDKKWVEDNIGLIFPANEFGSRLYDAVWDTLMLYVPAYDEPFLVLRAQYLEAIKNIGKVDKEKRNYTDRDERLIEHLMLFYGRGKLELSDKLLVEFWQKADDNLRGHALDFIGRNLKDMSEPEVLARYKKLWESRVTAFETSKDGFVFEKEAAAFGAWFSSGQFEEKWLSDQYIIALKCGRKNRSEHMVIDRLVELVKTLPMETMQILGELLLSGDQPSWIIMGNKEDIAKILSEALHITRDDVKEEAKKIINRLAARGFSDFNSLLV